MLTEGGVGGVVTPVVIGTGGGHKTSNCRTLQFRAMTLPKTVPPG